MLVISHFLSIDLTILLLKINKLTINLPYTGERGPLNKEMNLIQNQQYCIYIHASKR